MLDVSINERGAFYLNMYEYQPMWIASVGIVAAICTTLAFLPQAMKTIKTRQTQDLSFVMLSLQVLGNICWAQYGYFLSQPIVYVASMLTFTLVLIIWLLKLFHRVPSCVQSTFVQEALLPETETFTQHTCNGFICSNGNSEAFEIETSQSTLHANVIPVNSRL